MYINYSDIPGHPNLFLDYLYEFENVEKFYGKNFRDEHEYNKLFDSLESYDRPHREKVTAIIKEQYRNIRASKLTLSNIEELNSKNTIAVVTGQQLGIFGGPLYTFYKTMTAVKLAAYLNDKYDNFHFVPVFWLEGDDHDFDEVRKINILDRDNSLKTLSYEDGLDDSVNRGSVGNIKFNDNLRNLLEELSSSLRDSEFKMTLMDLLKSFYQPEVTFLESFRNLMIRLFDEYGLVVLNPSDPEIKKILAPVFKKELSDYKEHTVSLVERSAELEEIYHAQVKVKPVNLFYIDENERLSIEPLDEGFRLKGRRKKFSYDDMIAQLEFAPERFSPNVLLRPICQDYLLPTGFYVAGPAEISYFAQLTPLYNYFEINSPYIYPRASATILENNVQSLLDKYQLKIEEVFSPKEDLIEKIIARNSGNNIDAVFEEAQGKINVILDELGKSLIVIDKNMLDLTEKTGTRINENLKYLKNKAADAERRKHEVTIRQINKMQNVLYPNENLQERELNFTYFANKYGLDILKWIFNELSINKFEHQILEL
ncbi:bacillithiol biosynthesis cysteine-adding enzyme BshC [Melioribacter sp. Ez-97]|uniref:bacillithiol biosynthesis cysteine-adding enzyme BshC n=1 Tax=Melioribacter sp. Ez-97 TaxID=3423434 RepID=UPI003EDAC318